MPVEVVSYMLSSKNRRKRLQFQIIFQCAPFLKGIKVACIMNIERELCQELDVIFMGTCIEYRILTENSGRCLVFFFRKEELVSYLKGEEVRRFLERYGYVVQDFEKVLCRLSERVCQYYGQNGGFPHEIGAFPGLSDR